MLIDLGDGGPDELDGDVAIIGSGAAGNTLARSLLNRGLSIVLLESGGLDYEPESAALNAGANVGEPYYELEKARLRFFGGTTAIWGGRCAELDSIDFERRDWVPHSGWPITLDQLRPWYDKAREALGIPLRDEPVRNALLGRVAGGDLAIRQWAFDPDFERFGLANNRAMVDHPKAIVAIHATVREIVAEADGNSIAYLDVRAPGGAAHRVRARHFVLAAGGLENPRILLSSNSVASRGLGNDRDLVGRFFMEHPHGRGGRVLGARCLPLLNAFRARRGGRGEVAALLTLAEDAQRRDGVLNSGLTVGSRPPVDGKPPITKRGYAAIKHQIGPTSSGRALWRAYRRALRSARPLWVGAAAARCMMGREEPTLILRAEQAPNPDSRVLLSEERDSTGMPRIKLDWRLNSQDVDSAAALVATFAREAERAGIGRVEAAPWLAEPHGKWETDPLVSAHPIGGYHHMGTTRMADDPKQGVTDQWGRVHGVANLHVAGSSLFPTGGWANPTLTIIALAMRTADHIAGQARG